MSTRSHWPSAPHLVIATFGSLGDLHPYLAIAQAWQARGGRATVATSSYYRDVVEDAGIGFRAIRPDLPNPSQNAEFYHRVLDPLRGGARFLLQETIGKYLRESYDDLFAATHDADILLSHSMCVVAPLVAARRAFDSQKPMRWVSGVVSPMFLQSELDPPSLPFVPQLANAPIVGKYATRAWNAWLRRWLLAPLSEVENLRRDLRLPPGAHPLFGGAHSPHRVLALWSPEFAPPQRDWPSQARAVGFCSFDRAQKASVQEKFDASSTRLDEFLACGKAPMLFTLGASSALDAGNFWHENIAAVKMLHRRAIFAVGRPESDWPDVLHNLQPHILALPYVPLSRVLPRCEAVVHHGGIGTIAQALCAAIPMIIMPHSQDQPDNAQRAQKIGVARLIGKRNYHVSRVVHELQVLTTDPRYTRRVRQVSACMARERGAQTAGDWLERELR